MLSNLRNLGMAAEDRPWFSGRSVLLGSMLRPPRHRRWPHRGRSLLLANPPRTARVGQVVRRLRVESDRTPPATCSSSPPSSSPVDMFRILHCRHYVLSSKPDTGGDSLGVADGLTTLTEPSPRGSLATAS